MGESAPGDTEGASTPEEVQKELERFVATGIEGNLSKTFMIDQKN